MFELVNLIAGQVGRRCDLRAVSGQRDVARLGLSGQEFHFVEARLRTAVGFVDGEANELGARGGEAIDVGATLDGKTQGVAWLESCHRLEGPQRAFDLVQLGLHTGELLAVLVRLDLRERSFAVLHSREDRLHRVVIDLRDRVELVVVATGAADGQTEERAAGGAHHVVQFVGALLSGQAGIGTLHAVIRSAHDETGRLVRAEHVARKLLGDELRERHVVVERTDDVVAIRPRIGARLIRLEAIAFGKADHVEPVPRPALTKMRRRKQPIDESLVSIRPRVSHELGHFIGCGRQANQIERQPSKQRHTIRLGCISERGT